MYVLQKAFDSVEYPVLLEKSPDRELCNLLLPVLVCMHAGRMGPGQHGWRPARANTQLNRDPLLWCVASNNSDTNIRPSHCIHFSSRIGTRIKLHPLLSFASAYAADKSLCLCCRQKSFFYAWFLTAGFASSAHNLGFSTQLGPHIAYWTLSTHLCNNLYLLSNSCSHPLPVLHANTCHPAD